MSLEVADRFYFPTEAGAPFGELNLVKGDYNPSEGSNFSRFGYFAIWNITKEAWLTSSWLPEVIGEEKMQELKACSLPPFAEEAIGHSTRAWYAVSPPSHTKDYAISHGLSNHTSKDQVVGYAYAENEALGTLKQKLRIHLLHQDEVRACVSGFNVVQDQQGTGVEAALLYAPLSGFKPAQKLITYVMAANQSRIDELAELGFEPKDSRLRADLINGVELEEVRLEAASVAKVRGELASAFPWLKKAIAIN